MYEDHTVEGKYLHNFSEEEKNLFCKREKKCRDHMYSYQSHLFQLVLSDSPAIFPNYVHPNSPLEIKYILNRIAANDPRDTTFELGHIDDIKSPDALALHIAKAFRNNTLCKRIILNEIGLTDNGMLPILRALAPKEITLLNIAGNKTSDKSLTLLNAILSDPGNKWKQVQLGKISLSANQKEALEKHPNVSFTPGTSFLKSLGAKSKKFFSKDFQR